MKSLRRAASVYATEGLGGLVRRLAAKAKGSYPPTVASSDPADDEQRRLAARAEAEATFERQVFEFRERTHTLNVPGLEHFYWYHTVDLGNGLVTPGDYDKIETTRSKK